MNIGYDRIYPLTEVQRGVYFECMEDPESTKYNIPLALRLPAEIDVERFAKALEKVILSHPAFFVRIDVENDEPVMRPGSCSFSLSRSFCESVDKFLNGFVRPFNLEKGPLFRFELCDTPNGTVFAFDIHHLIFDGTSLRLLYVQLEDAYDGLDIPAEELTIFDVSESEPELKASPVYAEAKEYFRDILSNVEYDSGLIPDVDPSTAQCGEGRVTLYASESVSPELIEPFVEKLGVTESSLFTAAWAYALSIFSASKHSCFTIASHGRYDARLKLTSGMFVRVLPLHFEVNDECSVADFVREVQRGVHGALKHGCVSFSELASEYGVNTKVAFVYQGRIFSEVNIGGTSIMPDWLPSDDCASSDIVCNVDRSNSGYRIQTNYKSNLYSEGYIRSLSETVFTVLESMLRCSTLGEIKALSESSAKFIESFNSSARYYGRDETVNSYFDVSVAANADRTALVYKDRRWSFRELDRITRNLAAYLSGKGLCAEEFAAVLTPRNDEGVIAAWGAVRAGAAFQMLDPAYPAERLNFMINDSRAKILISDRALAPVMTDYDGEVLYTDEIFTLPDAPDFRTEVKPEAPVTLIYTSGTTGKPKGCILENRNLAAFYHNHIETMRIDGNSRIASYASFGFDAGSMDILTTPMAGGCLYVIPDDIRQEISKVDEFFCENGITHCMMTTQLARAFAEITKCTSLKAILTGGEKLVPFMPNNSFRFVNSYGPCETMAYVTWHDVKDASSIQPIGIPQGNTKLYVIDRLGREAPVGALGELTISGYQVGRGYLGLPDKTAESFVPNPFCDIPGYERMYRTGDVVRLLPCGELEFIGRRDSQVKIRGYRVELTEIEEVIRRFPGIIDATVAAFDDNHGGKFIAAYVVGDESIDADALKTFIFREKPDYFVPAVIMQIDAIPYTQNQKVNRRALPQPERRSTDSTKPDTEVQKKVFNIVAGLLGHEEFGILTDFFEAGLTSIGIMKMTVSLGREFNLPVRIADIRDNPTVKLLASFLESSESRSDIKLLDDYPLMQNQIGVLLDCGVDSETVRYNVPLLLKISDSIDCGRLKDAVAEAINAHPYIKAVIKTDAAGNFRAARNDDDAAVVEIVEIENLPKPEELIRPFNLLGGRLYRAVIYMTESGSYLFLDVHHVVSDGTSLTVLLRDVDKAYSGQDLQIECFTAYESAIEEQDEMSSETYAASEKYFDSLLSGCNTECLPVRCPDPSDESEGCAYYTLRLGCSNAVTDFCRRNSFSCNAFFNAVFSYTLSEFIHTDDVSYCTVYNGRNDSRLAEAFAMLVKTLPVRCEISVKSSVRAYVDAVQKQLMDSMANDIVPFSELSRKYSLKSDIFFNYQGDFFSYDSLCGEKAELIPLELSSAKAPLSVELFLDSDGFCAEFTYRTDFFCRELIDSFAGAFETAAEGFTSNESLNEISILSPEELAHFDEMNATDAPFEHIPAHYLIEAYAAQNPDGIAVKTASASLTFAELDTKANALANSLISLGACNGEIIGLILERDELVPVAELGILKAGCAFLPMLPSYPDDRVDYCLTDAGCRFVITSGRSYEGRPYASVNLEELIAGGNVKRPDLLIPSDNLAYCIYTSGSTGVPKGVMIEHHSLSNFVQTCGLRQLEAAGSAILCMASISFDMSITEMFFSLCCGKTIYIASEEEIHNLDLMLAAFKKNSIDMMMMTPSFAWSLLSIPEFESAMAQLKSIALGAEAFRPTLLSRLKTLNPDMLIFNGYGPTECTQVCSAKLLEEDSSITIGRPFANMKFYVGDDSGRLLPRYAVGELLICGEGVCRGYVNLPEKNASAFTKVNGLSAYRSGDLVRINRDNEVEFCGRADNQVKLRGFRVELDEVEAVMQEFPGVLQSKVLVRNNGTEDFLAAFFTAEFPVSLDELTDFMKTKLTYYMVPAAIMQLEKMPMTQNGKLDKKALPEIRPQKKKREKRAPKKSLEEKILELFRSVLDIDDCYADDNFFEIGGTSLSASKVVMQIKAEGYKIEYQDIFDHQTAEELAEYLESLRPSCSKSEIHDEDVPLYKTDARIAEVLKFNSMEYAAEVSREPLGTVLLTGATGFLGIHILKELIDNESGNIICLLRKGNYDDLETRLKASLVYYFEDDFDEKFSHRISLIEGDITDDNLPALLKDVHFDTLINCAACVKHYAKDNSIEFVNVHGVENLISLTVKNNAKMIQISTTSVPGAHNEETYRINLRMAENQLFVIDDMNNQYGQSKYKAELLMLDAISKGMRGKIIRVGNLMGRYSDGEFQTNMRTNAFLNGLRGFVNIGKSPLSHSTDPMSFSPIDCTARAVVLLAGTNDMFTAFHADSRARFDEMKVIDAINRCGITVKPVQDEEYYADFNRMMSDPEKNEKVSALLTNDRPDMHMVVTENRFTANVLYRLGFSWPFIDDNYLETLIRSLDTLDFFS